MIIAPRANRAASNRINVPGGGGRESLDCPDRRSGTCRRCSGQQMRSRRAAPRRAVAQTTGSRGKTKTARRILTTTDHARNRPGLSPLAAGGGCQSQARASETERAMATRRSHGDDRALNRIEDDDRRSRLRRPRRAVARGGQPRPARAIRELKRSGALACSPLSSRPDLRAPPWRRRGSRVPSSTPDSRSGQLRFTLELRPGGS